MMSAPIVSPMTDTGHYNCRDYHVNLPTTSEARADFRPHYIRHESYDELMQRSQSPASQQPRFPLLALPLELRQQIFSYLMPKTLELKQGNPLGNHARSFSAVQKRSARGMALPDFGSKATEERDDAPSTIVWVRGNTSLLQVCSQLHRECMELLYGRNTFLLFVTYNHITFRFRWLLPSGLAPSRSYNLLELMPQRYLKLIRRVIVHVDHVDSYTGMIKFNVSGKGLTHGIKKQVQKLVLALQPLNEEEEQWGEYAEPLDAVQPLSKVLVRVSNANTVLDNIRAMSKGKEEEVKALDATSIARQNDDIAEMLSPFGDLASVGKARIIGAVSDVFARKLENRMMSNEPRKRQACCCEENMAEQEFELAVRRLCEH